MKRNARRKRPMIYHSKTVKKDVRLAGRAGKTYPPPRSTRLGFAMLFFGHGSHFSPKWYQRSLLQYLILTD